MLINRIETSHKKAALVRGIFVRTTRDPSRPTSWLRGVSGLAKELKTQGSERGKKMELDYNQMGNLKSEEETLETDKTKEQKFSRVMVSMETKSALEHLARSVNYGFRGGHIGPKEVVEWLVERSMAGFSKQEINDIRAAYTFEKLILEQILDKAAKADDQPGALRKVIREVSVLGPKRPYQSGYKEKERLAFADRLKALKAGGV
jgi:hypothetical protein